MAVPVFFGRPHADAVRFGSYTGVVFARAELIADGKAVAKHIEHRWQVHGLNDRFSSLEVRARVEVCFGRDSERSKAFGPFDTFRLMDGIAYASGHVFAFFDLAQQDWYSLGLGRHWPNMLVVSANAKPQREPDLADDSAPE
jgi:hypothetical protein